MTPNLSIVLYVDHIVTVRRVTTFITTDAKNVFAHWFGKLNFNMTFVFWMTPIF